MRLFGLLSATVVFLLASGAGVAEEKVDDQLRQIEKRQVELTKKEIQAYKSDVSHQIIESELSQSQKSAALENQITAIGNKVSLRLGLWGLGVLAIGTIIGFLVGLRWGTREVEKIVEYEKSASRERIRKVVFDVLSSEDRETQEGLDASIKRSVQRIKKEKDSKILIVVGEKDNKLNGLLPRLGFNINNFNIKPINDVYDGSTPKEQGYDLVILDSLSQKDAYDFIESGSHQGYLLYNDGAQYKFGSDKDNDRPYPYQFDRNRTVIANSKPAVYGHVMTLLSFNKVDI